MYIYMRHYVKIYIYICVYIYIHAHAYTLRRYIDAYIHACIDHSFLSSRPPTLISSLLACSMTNANEFRKTQFESASVPAVLHYPRDESSTSVPRLRQAQKSQRLRVQTLRTTSAQPRG
jgi:hypothetical protein